jgi:hypothetical protein
MDSAGRRSVFTQSIAAPAAGLKAGEHSPTAAPDGWPLGESVELAEQAGDPHQLLGLSATGKHRAPDIHRHNVTSC